MNPRDYTKLTETLRTILLARLQSGSLVLPTLPKVAQELQQLLDDQKVDQSKLVKLVENDPVLVANVMRVANSQMHRRSGKMESVSKAIAHLGIRGLKNILMGLVGRQIFVSHDPRMNSTLASMWEHAMATAMLSRNVAGICGCRDVEPAYVAGLLHDIGKVVVAIYLLEFERGLPIREAMDWIDHDSWMAIIEELHREVGCAITEHWNLPNVIGRIIEDYEDYDAADRISPLNSVLFSNALAKKVGIYEGIPDQDAVQSMIMIGKSLLSIDDTVISGLTREINDHVFM